MWRRASPVAEELLRKETKDVDMPMAGREWDSDNCLGYIYRVRGLAHGYLEASLFLLLMAVALLCYMCCTGKGSAWLIGAFVLAAFLLTVIGKMASTSAFDDLRTEFGKLQPLESYEKFCKEFRPTRETVEKILTEAALAVRKAHEAKVAFYETGLTGWKVDKTRQLEDQGEVLRKQAKIEEERLEGEVKAALERYYHLWQLTDDLDYNFPNSWKPLAGLPWNEKLARLENSVKDMSDLVEGRNEPASEGCHGPGAKKVG